MEQDRKSYEGTGVCCRCRERENILEVNMNTNLMNKRSFNIPL